ncbi:hypothetical protein B5S28_g1533 [[Candida] boidinii]|uniref:Unnamed protein product n=1 Tax=Candida boidinii TaxID=5477 RepID=A0ACB5TIC0_CANBO|nr:hypothetical protein B5S28_g1533 [[Candida] boidinii]OWB60977.1 hypothetical protein B5S29_g1860 [[Candida] boidinii]OWB78408.1 hypothetical protein B5S32_g2602 [[Candida] boidinii]GME89243.1 unnamed protein product [[Candida] boidinii]GMF42276.1 unnamed protein product [[Candida] boidinii]
MNRLFGTRNNVPKPSINDAVKNIDERVSTLDIQLSKINTELTTYQQKLSKLREGPGKNAIKARAMKLLRQRKQIESQKDQLLSQSWNMTQAQMTTDNLKNTMITIDAMKSANKELKKTYGKINIDKLEDLQDEMLDLIDQSNELQDSLSRSYDVPDDISESELDAELEALGEEMNMESDLNLGESNIPSYLTSEDQLPSFVDEQPETGETDKEEKVAAV